MPHVSEEAGAPHRGIGLPPSLDLGSPAPEAILTRSPAPRSAATQALLAAAAGDVAAFGRVIDLLGAHVHGLVRTLVRDRETAVTLTRQFLVDAWRDAPQFSATDRTAEAWLLSRVHRGAVACLRSDEGPVRQADERSSEGWRHFDGAPRVRDAAAALDELERQVLASAYFAGRTCDEAARELGVPVASVRTALRQALRRLGPQLLRPNTGRMHDAARRQVR